MLANISGQRLGMYSTVYEALWGLNIRYSWPPLVSVRSTNGLRIVVNTTVSMTPNEGRTGRHRSLLGRFSVRRHRYSHSPRH